MEVRLSVAIQNHPSRASSAESLKARLAPLDVEVVTDPDPGHHLPNPWRTYRKALEETPDWATHRLIIQDDVTLCDGFAEAAPRAVAALHPDHALVFCHLGRPRDNLHRLDAAYREGSPLVEISIDRWAPVVALCWPKRVICPCVCWTYDQDWPDTFRADDEIVGQAMRAHGVRVWATVPSLVQHLDVMTSLIGKKAWAGEDPGRVAHRFLESPSDARDIEWS